MQITPQLVRSDNSPPLSFVLLYWNITEQNNKKEELEQRDSGKVSNASAAGKKKTACAALTIAPRAAERL